MATAEEAIPRFNPQGAAAAQEDTNEVAILIRDAVRCMLTNGPITVSSISGGDVVNYTTYGRKRRDFWGTVDLIIRNSSEIPDWAKPVVGIAAALYEDDEFKVISSTNIVDIPGGAGISIGDMTGYATNTTTHHMACARSIPFVTKLLFFQTNHHVGGSGPATGKMMRSLAAKLKGDPNSIDEEVDFSDEEISGFKSMVWAIGHLYDTKKVLHMLGFKTSISEGVKAELDSLNGKLNLERDLLLRARASPAGTAKVADFLTAIKHIAQSKVSDYLALPASAEYAHRFMASVKKDPLRFHVGSQYLTGKKAIIPDDIPPTDVADVRAVMEVIAPGSSLLRSALFKEVKASAIMKQRVIAIAKDLAEKSKDASLASTNRAGWNVMLQDGADSYESANINQASSE